MTQKANVITQHNDTCGLEGASEYGEGRKQLMVSQKQMPFMFLVMPTLPEMKNLNKQMMRKAELTIQHDDRTCR